MDNTGIKYKEAIKESIEIISQDPNSIFLGYNVKYGSMGDGAYKNIPTEKLIETPVAENLMLSMAIGMSINGYLPIVFYERFDFILNALDAMVNHLDKIKDMSEGQFKPKVIIRAVIGGKLKPFFTGPTHTQDFTETIKSLVRFPVIKLFPDYQSIKNTYLSALNSKESTLIIEEKDLYDKIVT